MEEKTFRNLQSVAVYLRGEGWKVSKSTLYEHSKSRKIKAREDGLFYLSDIEVYANKYLKKKNATYTQSTDAILKRRNEAEAKKLEWQAEHWRIKAKVEAGAYVESSAFEHALAQRAMLFKNDLELLARSKAPEICRRVGGNNELIPELMEYLLDTFAVFLNRYAQGGSFTVPLPKTDIMDDSDLNENENAEFLDNSPE